MRVRGGAYGGAGFGSGAGSGAVGWVRSWRVSAKVTIARACGMIGFAVGGFILRSDRSAALVAILAVLVLGAWVLRDVLVPVRLATDEQGIVVATGFVGRAAIGWDQVTRVLVRDSRRLGLRSRTLEIEAGEGLHLFGEYDLDADLDEVAVIVEELRGRFLNHQSRA